MRLWICAVSLLILAGCATRQLPPYEPPLAKTEYQKIRTTAYTSSESDHRRHGALSALGTPLRTGWTNSAAADSARWPAGTVFQILATGEVFEVDDYGWALAGTNTIDIYKPTQRDMNEWGVRRVTIRILQWGDPAKSYGILKDRARFAHVGRMVSELRGEL